MHFGYTPPHPPLQQCPSRNRHELEQPGLHLDCVAAANAASADAASRAACHSKSGVREEALRERPNASRGAVHSCWRAGMQHPNWWWISITLRNEMSSFELNCHLVQRSLYCACCNTWCHTIPCTDKTLRKWQSDMNSDKCWRDLLKQGVQNKCLERWIPGLFEMCHSTCSLWWFQFVICTSQCNSSCTSSMLWSSDQGHCSNQGPFPELLVLGKGYSDCWGFDRPYFNCNLLSFRTWPKPLVGLGRQGYSLGIRLMDSGYGCEWSLWL